jgi:hypothetical protein
MKKILRWFNIGFCKKCGEMLCEDEYELCSTCSGEDDRFPFGG